jgi:hypothetical protein
MNKKFDAESQMKKKKAREGERMYNVPIIENYFRKMIQDVPSYLPEGLIHVDIDLLQNFDLFNLDKKPDTALTRYFHVIDTLEKITLINDQFIIWIVPENKGRTLKTYVYIAINKNSTPHLELVFVTSDIYNSSKLVLRILEKFLYEIQENEEAIASIQNQP